MWSLIQYQLLPHAPFMFAVKRFTPSDAYVQSLSLSVNEAHFFSSHLDGMKRRLGSGALDSGWISCSLVNQSASGSKGFT